MASSEARGQGIGFTKEYTDYLKSFEWKVRRLRYLESVEYRCEECGAKATQVHHLNYDALDAGKRGREADDDLMALCQDCHEIIHEEINAERETAYRIGRVQKYALKVFGSGWLRYPGLDTVEDAFNEWLERKRESEGYY